MHNLPLSPSRLSLPYLSSQTPTPSAAASLQPDPLSQQDTVDRLTDLFTQPAALALLQLAPLAATAASMGSGPLGHSATSLSTNATSSNASELGHLFLSQPGSAHSSLNEAAQPSFLGNEQLSASVLQLPIATVAALWRSLKGITWAHHYGHRSPSVTLSAPSPMTRESTFDFAALVQGAVDVMAPIAASTSMELVLHHVTSVVTNDPEVLQMGVIEAHVKAEEVGLNVAITAVRYYSLCMRWETGTDLEMN